MLLAHCRAFPLSVMPGNRRRSSIAAASASVTTNMVGKMAAGAAPGKIFPSGGGLPPAIGLLP